MADVVDRVVGAVAVVLVVGSLGGAVLATQTRPDGDGLVEGGPVAFTTDGVDGGMDAALTGTLSVGSCVTVVAEDGRRLLPFFPDHRTSWDGRTLRISWWWRAFSDGDRIVLGGGGVLRPPGREPPGYVPEDCSYDGWWIVST